MPSRSEIEITQLGGWAGGWNTEASDFLLGSDELRYALNVIIGPNGELRKRRGVEKLTTDSDPDGFDTTRHDHIIADGTVSPRFATVSHTAESVWTYNTSASAAAQQFTGFDGPTADHEWDVGSATFEGRTYITANRQISPIFFHSAGQGQLTPTDFDGTSGEFPRARTLVAAHNRMFAANVRTASNVQHNSRLYFSDPLDAETWPSNNFFDFQPKDGTQISKIIEFGGQILVFKDHSIHALIGDDKTDFAAERIDNSVGTTTPRTVVDMGGVLYFLDPFTGVWRFDGATLDRVSDKIHRALMDAINHNTVYQAHAFEWEGRYYLNIPSASVDTFVYDPRLDAWTRFNFGTFDATKQLNEDTGKEILIGVGPTIGVDLLDGAFELFKEGVYLDNGEGYLAQIETGRISPRGVTTLHRLRRLDLVVEVGDYADDNPTDDPKFSVWVRGDISISGITEKVVDGEPYVQMANWSNQDRWRSVVLHVRDYLSSNANAWQINAIYLHTSTVAVRSRGETE